MGGSSSALRHGRYKVPWYGEVRSVEQQESPQSAKTRTTSRENSSRVSNRTCAPGGRHATLAGAVSEGLDGSVERSGTCPGSPRPRRSASCHAGHATRRSRSVASCSTRSVGGEGRGCVTGARTPIRLGRRQPSAHLPLSGRRAHSLDRENAIPPPQHRPVSGGVRCAQRAPSAPRPRSTRSESRMARHTPVVHVPNSVLLEALKEMNLSLNRLDAKIRSGLDAVNKEISDIRGGTAGTRGASPQPAARVSEDITYVMEHLCSIAWCYVESGHADEPLGMAIATQNGGRHRGARGAVRNGAAASVGDVLELMVCNDRLALVILASAVGWPCEGFSQGGCTGVDIGNHPWSHDVFVRRETLRVWSIVSQDLRHTASGLSAHMPHAFVLYGSHGIGKSFGVGSFLLFMLLQHSAEEVPVVAYLMGERLYLFQKAWRGRSARATFTQGSEASLQMVNQAMKENKRGYFIYDAPVQEQLGVAEWAMASGWGGILLDAQNEKARANWGRRGGCRSICVNPMTEVELKAVLVWTERDVLHRGALALAGKKWAEIRERVRSVGPLLKYVLDGKRYMSRLQGVMEQLSLASEGDVGRCVDALIFNEGSLGRKRHRKLVKLVRTGAHSGGDQFRTFAVSEMVLDELIKTSIFAHARRRDVSSFVKLLALGWDAHRAELFNHLAVYAFLCESILSKAVDKIVHLPTGHRDDYREPLITRRLRNGGTLAANKLRFFTSRDSGLRVKTDVLYVPRGDPTFPLLSAFLFKEGTENTFIGLAPAQRISADATYAAAEALMKRLSLLFARWESICPTLLCEVIYLQSPWEKPMAVKKSAHALLHAGPCGEAGRDISQRLLEGARHYQLMLDAKLVRESLDPTSVHFLLLEDG
ncbi:putative Retrotransposon hot spot protein [Trypanosoma vivax]|nr:putative Retrotransposon hot spot protein [Trypanosoma vivax]